MTVLGEALENLVGRIVPVLLRVEEAPVLLLEEVRALRSEEPLDSRIAVGDVVPVISLSPSFLPKPPPAESIVADGSRPSASQRTGWFDGSE